MSTLLYLEWYANHVQDERGIPYKQTKRYKKAHARYMKYFRSVHESLDLNCLWLSSTMAHLHFSKVPTVQRKSERWQSEPKAVTRF